MKIEVQNLMSGPETVVLDHRPKYFSLEGEDYEVLDNITGSITFSLMGDRVFMKGHLCVRLRVTCVTCLVPVDVSVDKDVCVLYVPSKAATESELHFSPEEDDVAYYQGKVIIPDDDIRDLILIDLPEYPRCREDCRGLCPRCGANLNEKDCGCPPMEDVPVVEPVADTSWKDHIRGILPPE